MIGMDKLKSAEQTEHMRQSSKYNHDMQDLMTTSTNIIFSGIQFLWNLPPIISKYRSQY